MGELGRVWELEQGQRENSMAGVAALELRDERVLAGTNAASRCRKKGAQHWDHSTRKREGTGCAAREEALARELCDSPGEEDR